MTYEIVAGGEAIRCLKCGRVSFSPGDIEHLYCGMCGYHVPTGTERYYLSEPMYLLLNALRRGERDPQLKEGPVFTDTLRRALEKRRYIGPGPTVTGRGFLALQEYENPN